MCVEARKRACFHPTAGDVPQLHSPMLEEVGLQHDNAVKFQVLHVLHFSA